VSGGKVGTPVPKAKDPAHEPYITVTQGMSGYFAVLLWWNPDMGGFYEPWDTGIGRYGSREEAAVEGRQWAEAEELRFLAS
jgi:hypothetical protein